MKAYGEWVYRSTSSSTRHSFTSLQLYPRGKSPPYPSDRRLDWPQSRYVQYEEEKILGRTVTRTPTRRSSKPQKLAIPTTLPRPTFHLKITTHRHLTYFIPASLSSNITYTHLKSLLGATCNAHLILYLIAVITYYRVYSTNYQ
jgi:hypothetical protein